MTRRGYTYLDAAGYEHFVQRVAEGKNWGRDADKYRLVSARGRTKPKPATAMLYDTAEDAQRVLDQCAIANGWKEF